MNEPKYHPVTFVAFLLAIFILVWPVQADMVVSSLRAGRIVEAILTVAVTIAAVAAPLIFAQWTTRRHPEKWKSRLLTKLTWVIILLNVAMNVGILVNFRVK